MGEVSPILGHVIAVEGSRVTGVLVPGNAAGEVTAEFGAMVKISTGRSMTFGCVTRLWSEKRNGEVVSHLTVDLLGEIPLTDDNDVTRQVGFRRGLSVYPHLSDAISPVTTEDLHAIYAPPAEPHVRIGSVERQPDLPAHILTDRLLGKHFAILGTTGTGKSCAVALILRTILDTHPGGHLVILDPHNEYAPAFRDRAELVSPDDLYLPYWLLNFEEMVATFVAPDGPWRENEVAILKRTVLAARREFVGDEEAARHVTVDTPVPFRLGDVERGISFEMGRLNKAETTLPYVRLLSRLETLRAEQRYAFMFSGLVVRDTMAEILSRLLRVPVNGRPATVIDMSGVPSDIVDVVVSVLSRLIFDFSLWNAQPQSVPILMVCEEAHRYLPEDPALGFDLTRQAISRIVKEGRKYGVSLCLVTQRPSELSATILSQCNTIFALRMTNEHDQEFVRRALPDGGGGLLMALPALHNREAIAVGEGVSVPMRLYFDHLDEAHRPRGGTASFTHAWSGGESSGDLLTDTIHRWRLQMREDGVLDDFADL